MPLLNRVLSAVLALALLLGGLLAAAEVVVAALGRPPLLVPHRQWGSTLAGLTWEDALVRAVLVGLVLLGLLLLVLALRPGRPRDVALPARSGGPSGVHVTATRRGVERALASAARRTDGVHGADARLRRRSVRVRATTSVRSPGDLQQRTTAAVTQRLDDLGLAGVLRPRVTVSEEGR